MGKQVLFIQGAGEGAHEEDKKLATSLQNVLGTDYQVLYPPMPDEADPKDEVWRAQISKELDSMEGKVILVGHSAGGAVLLKYLLKENIATPIAGVFLISILTGDLKMSKRLNIHCRRVSLHACQSGSRSFCIIAVMTSGCRLHIWESMPKKSPRLSLVNLMGADISLTMIFPKSRLI